MPRMSPFFYNYMRFHVKKKPKKTPKIIFGTGHIMINVFKLQKKKFTITKCYRLSHDGVT